MNINIGLKVFMDAHKPVTLEEGDRYPLGPPVSRSSYSGNTLAFQAKARSSILLLRSMF